MRCRGKCRVFSLFLGKFELSLGFVGNLNYTIKKALNPSIIRTEGYAPTWTRTRNLRIMSSQGIPANTVFKRVSAALLKVSRKVSRLGESL